MRVHWKYKFQQKCSALFPEKVIIRTETDRNMIYLTDWERLAVIAGMLAFLALCFLIMVCKLTPSCWLHECCPFKAKYDQEYNMAKDKIYQPAKDKKYDSTSSKEQLPLSHPQVNRWRQIQVLRSPPDSSSEGEDIHVLDRVHKKDKSIGFKDEDSFVSSDIADSTDSPALVEGEIDFTLFYPKEDDSNLHIKIHKVSNLIFQRCEKVKLCIRIQLLHKENNLDRILKFFKFLDPEEQDKNMEYETQTSLKAVHKILEWDEVKRVPLKRDEAQDRCVRFLCCLYDQFSQPNPLGETIVALNDVMLDENVVINKTLSASQQKRKGELMVSLSYLPTAQKIIILPVECRQLKIMDTKYPSCVYVRVAMVSHGTYRKKKTRVKETQSRIIWKDPVNFDLPCFQLTDVSIIMTLKQSITYPDMVRDIDIGKVVLGCITGSVKAQKHWKEMMQTPRQPRTEWHTIL